MRTEPFANLSPLQRLAREIAGGKTTFTPDELQLQSNYPDELEQLLNGLKTPAPAKTAAPVKETPAPTTPQPAAPAPVRINWIVTILLVIAAAALVYFFMKNKIPVPPVVTP